MYKYFWNDSVSKLIGKMPGKYVSLLAVKLYLGSPCKGYIAIPKNTDMAFNILNAAIENTKDYENLMDIKFSKAYLTKIKGMETDDSSLVESGNNQLKSLCSAGHPPALVEST